MDKLDQTQLHHVDWSKIQNTSNIKQIYEEMIYDMESILGCRDDFYYMLIN